MALLNYNGFICTEEEALCTGLNRAFRYGEGLIETMLWQEGRIRLLELHEARLAQSLSCLGFPPFSARKLQQEINKLMQACQAPGRGKVRAQFFREEDPDLLQFMISFTPLNNAAAIWPDKGLHIGICRDIVKSSDSIAHLKTSSRLPYLVAGAAAKRNDWDDALLLNPSGNIVESTICNIFMIRDQEIGTPPLNEGCIAGVMRRYLLDQGTIAGLPVVEAAFDETSMASASELFLSNAVSGIRPVAACNGKTYDSTLTRNIFDTISLL